MRAPLMILLAGVLRVFAADATEPVVAGVTSTAAVLRYTAPDGGACRIEASESESFVPLAADVDAALFPGADLDSRPGSLAAGLTRVVVIGRRSMSRPRPRPITRAGASPPRTPCAHPPLRRRAVTGAGIAAITPVSRSFHNIR